MDSYPEFSFDIHYTSQKSRARIGTLNTPHGPLETPAFIFCATKAAMKIATIKQTKDENTQIILGNTYHLHLQPGEDLICEMGGLHKFTGWDGPMLTDSGGFQVFSLGHGGVVAEIKGEQQSQKRKKSLLGIDESGARFKSYIDGSIKTLTPESAIEIQRKIGADIILVLDECTPFHVTKDYTANSMRMSHRWAKRGLEQFRKDTVSPATKKPQALYGIVQGGVYADLRKESAEFASEQDFFGIAVGGCLGSSKEQMYDVTSMAMDYVRRDCPVHLLGIGGIRDVWEGVQRGIDTFDCVTPTRIARHGSAYIKGRETNLNLVNARFKNDPEPLDTSCGCYTCQTHSRGYIHHLFKAKEMLGMQLLAIHNIHFMNDLMSSVRQAIKSDSIQEEMSKWLEVS